MASLQKKVPVKIIEKDKDHYVDCTPQQAYDFHEYYNKWRAKEVEYKDCDISDLSEEECEALMIIVDLEKVAA